MAYSMMSVESAGFEIVLTVHDELLAEGEDRDGLVDLFAKTMARKAEWGESCPIKVKCYDSERYVK